MPFLTKNLNTPAAKKRTAKAAAEAAVKPQTGQRLELPAMYTMVTLSQVGELVCPHKPAVSRTVRDWIVKGAGPAGYKVKLRCTVTPKLARVCSMADVLAFLDDLRDANQRCTADMEALRGGQLDKYRARALADKMAGLTESTKPPTPFYPPLHPRYKNVHLNLKRGGRTPGAQRHGQPEPSPKTA